MSLSMEGMDWYSASMRSVAVEIGFEHEEVLVSAR